MAAFAFTARFRKREYAIHLTTADPNLGQVASAIASATGADAETIKLSVPGRKGLLLRPTTDASVSAVAAGEPTNFDVFSILHVQQPTSVLDRPGLQSGVRVEVYASTRHEVQQVRNSNDLPGLASFEQELKQSMRRQRGSRKGTLTLPSGAYVFQKFEAWQLPGLSPIPTEALKLLHRLAADPGIAGIMTKHRWSVGLLSEMPPEGKVGVSPVCILGVNINAGQEISLRLRTDDLKGFRRYDRIRETLCHELAHMVWGEHDNRFKELNSQLLKECSQMDWTGHAGHAVSGTTDPAFENPAEPMWVDEDDVMAVTAQSSGQTLRQLAGAGQDGIARVSSDPRRAAAMAASARLASAATSPSTSRSASPEASRTGGNVSPQEADLVSGSAAAAAATGAEVAIDPDADIASMGHRDPSTEQAEDAMRALGSVDYEQQAAALQSHHSAAGNLTPELSTQQTPSDAPSQLPHQQSGDMTQTAASSHQPKESSPSDIRRTSGPVKDLGSQHQAALPQPQHAQHAQREEDMHQAAAMDHIMPEDLAPTSQQLQTEGGQKQPRDSSQLHTATHQEAAHRQGNPSHQQTEAGQELARQQQEHKAMAADPDDPAVQRYRQAEAAIAQLKFEAGASRQQSALETLSKILQNIASHPGETKYTHIRLANMTFHTRAGQYAAARQLLKVAGFSEEAEGTADKALVWRRNDQGLVWLTLSAVKNALAQTTYVH